MSKDPLAIFMGLIIILVIGYGLNALYSFLFLRYFKKQKIEKSFWFSVLTASLAWAVVLMLSLMFGSGYGMLVFGLVLTVFLFLVGLGLGTKIWALDSKARLFYSIGFSVIINPVWYFLITG